MRRRWEKSFTLKRYSFTKGLRMVVGEGRVGQEWREFLERGMDLQCIVDKICLRKTSITDCLMTNEDGQFLTMKEGITFTYWTSNTSYSLTSTTNVNFPHFTPAHHPPTTPPQTSSSNQTCAFTQQFKKSSRFTVTAIS